MQHPGALIPSSHRLSCGQPHPSSGRKGSATSLTPPSSRPPPSCDLQEAVESITAYANGDQDPNDSEEVNFITNTLKGLQILVEPIDNANGREMQPPIGLLNTLPIPSLLLFLLSDKQPSKPPFLISLAEAPNVLESAPLSSNESALLLPRGNRSADLKTLKALEPLVAMLKASLPIRMGAASVIGTAASNNPTFQGERTETPVHVPSGGRWSGKALSPRCRACLLPPPPPPLLPLLIDSPCRHHPGSLI